MLMRKFRHRNIVNFLDAFAGAWAGGCEVKGGETERSGIWTKRGWGRGAVGRTGSGAGKIAITTL
eukprot:6188081-Pleurochrysis_carterae.AAC.1